MNQENRGTDFFKGLMIGGAIGAAFALLFAPKTGIELRADLRRKSRELYDETETKFGEWKVQADEVLEQGKRQAESLRSQAEAKLSDARAKAEQVVNEGRAKARDLVDQSAKVVEREKSRVKSALDAGVKAYREEVDGNESRA